jgi:bifunctional UDP-N-acetylglucosamine pyrophosphorylase/glucosamine-1-phosphate N-acetyltransferase
MMNIVILAAGMGKRMHSSLPKVLHTLAGKSLLHHVIEAAQKLSPVQLCVVYGHGGDLVPASIQGQQVQFAKQEPQLGTGHAVQCALPLLDERYPTLVLYGDVPLISEGTLKRLCALASLETLAILTMELDDPTGYGRILRQAGEICRIVEQKEASVEEQAIKEVNTGIMVAPTPLLKQWLSSLKNENAQKEYYLTDVVVCAVESGIKIVSTSPEKEWEVLGVNSKTQLSYLERIFQQNQAQILLDKGVTLLDPARLDVRGTLHCEEDVIIDVGCVFEGEVVLKKGVHIGPYCIIKNASIESYVQIKAFCHIEGAHIGQDAVVGPYARLRLGTQLAKEVHIGNFVEIKNSVVGNQSKANHLTYIGDALVGERVNIGAGVITCNYDGANKWKTVIEDDVFVGSDVQLIAPVTVGRGATIGAGTTLTKDAPKEALTVSRAKQTSIMAWQRPVKKQKKEEA